MRINAGYEIISSIHIGNSEFVLGVNINAPDKFVTWKCSNGNDYCWGHYFGDLFAAEKNLIVRAQEEIEYLEQINSKSEKRKQVKEKERER